VALEPNRRVSIIPYSEGFDINRSSKTLKTNAGNWLRKYTKGILKRNQYVIFPSFFTYEVSSKAVDIQNRTNERTEEMVNASFRAEAHGFALIGKVIPPD
jgi:hypothetical protein